MNIFLKQNKGFKWYTKNTISFKGYFYNEGVFYEKENALNYLLNAIKNEKYKDLSQKLNGVFSLIITDEKSTFIACDISRAFPIFYTFQNDTLVISDDIVFLKNTYKINEFDKVSGIEFRVSNHTHNKKTLLKNVYQLQASQFIIFSNNKLIEENFLFSYALKKENKDNYQKLKIDGILAFENSFQRFINSLNNRTVLVPLSAGFDSRLIAVMLKKNNYKNVICFTYGSKNSFEIENSKKTAKILGFEWHFIEYTETLITDFLETKEFKEYTHFAGKLSSMPYLQEYFAVKYFFDTKAIPADSIFVPGFAGDILGGSEFLSLPENIKTSEIKNLLITNKFSNNPISKKEENELKKELSKNLIHLDKKYPKNKPSSVFEDYNIKERIAKYIFNSSSQYLFFNYQFSFPFWDQELLNFFKNVPEKYKREKLLFDDILINEYFKPNHVFFDNELQPQKKNLKIQWIKNRVKPFAPKFIKQKLLKKQDWNNYEPITKQMLLLMQKKGLKITRSYKNYNEIITQWYLYLVKNKLD